jgi:NAD(P)-dependent dehydrogenase (short-subunit alcohol dehydrogenase family)
LNQCLRHTVMGLRPSLLTPEPERMDGKTVVLTGGTGGIGKEITKGLAKLNARIILASRNMEKCKEVADEIRTETNNPKIECMECNLASFESIQNFVAELRKRNETINVLINNAAVFVTDRRVNESKIELSMAVNSYGPFLLSVMLVPNLRRGAPSRVINVNCRSHKRAPDQFRLGHQDKKFLVLYSGYNLSKKVNHLWTQMYAKAFRYEGIAAFSVDPGEALTSLGANGPWYWWKRLRNRWGFLYTPAQAAMPIVFFASNDRLQKFNGAYWSRYEVERMEPKNETEADRNRLRGQYVWQIHEDHTDVIKRMEKIFDYKDYTIVTGAINELKGYYDEAKTIVTTPDGKDKEIFTYTYKEVGLPIRNNDFLLPKAKLPDPKVQLVSKHDHGIRFMFFSYPGEEKDRKETKWWFGKRDVKMGEIYYDEGRLG